MVTYICDNDAAARAVSEILADAPAVLGVDIETAPKEGLENYPSSVSTRPTLRQYQKYAETVIWRNLSPYKLAREGLAGPQQIAAFEGSLDPCRWDDADLSRFKRETEETLRELRAARRQTKKIQTRIAELEATLALVNPPAKLPSELIRHICRVAVERFPTSDPVRPGLDPLTTDVFTIQLAYEAGEVKTFVFNLFFCDSNLLRPIFDLDSVFVFANAAFDIKFLYTLYPDLRFKSRIFDVLVAASLLELGKGTYFSLASAAKKFLGVDVNKEVRASFVGVRNKTLTPEQLDYAATDAKILLRLFDALSKRCAALPAVWSFSKLQAVIARWETEGYEIDRRWWLEKSYAEFVRRRDELAAQLKNLLDTVDFETARRNAIVMGFLEATLRGKKTDNGNANGDANEYDNDYEDDFDDDYIEDADDDDDDADGKREPPKRVSLYDRLTPEEKQLGWVLQPEYTLTQRTQVLPRLAALLGIEPAPISLSKEGRGKLERDVGGHQFFRLYEEWAKAQKAVTTYGEKFLRYIHPLSGRIHSSFRNPGTFTGRIASTAPNLLNIPASEEVFRRAFVAPAGKFLVSGDFASMEIRIAGDVARDPTIKRMAEENVDVHSFTAALMFLVRLGPEEGEEQIEVYDAEGKFVVTRKIVVDDVETAALKEIPNVSKRLRKLAKMVGFLWLFGGSHYALSRRTGVDERYCRFLLSSYNAIFSKVAEYRAGVMNRALTKTTRDGDCLYSWAEGYGGIRRFCKVPPELGRRRYSSPEFLPRAAKKQFFSAARALMNLSCQGGNAVITAEALVRLYEAGFDSWLAIYDEIVLTVSSRENWRAEEAREIVLEAANKYMKYVPAGFEWGEPAPYWKKG